AAISVTAVNVAPTFLSGDGTVTPVGTSDGFGQSVTIQPDGKVLVGGEASNGSNSFFALVRYNADGSLDSSFGTGGKVTTDFGVSWDGGNSVTVQADGKIVVAGSTLNGSNWDFALVRYNADGSLDARFDLASTLGGSVSYTENGTPVVLDSNVQIFDAELSSTNFSGATLTLVRNGGANSQDLFSATGTLGALTQGGNLVVGGTTIGTVTTNSSGTLVLTFNSSATNALVNSAMQQIAYANSSDAPPSSVQIDWTFSDGNSG
ncbi:MAG: delta-60 repeat domain-containing protein, partial [Planctomycetota bacterium]